MFIADAVVKIIKNLLLRAIFLEINKIELPEDGDERRMCIRVKTADVFSVSTMIFDDKILRLNIFLDKLRKPRAF